MAGNNGAALNGARGAHRLTGVHMLEFLLAAAAVVFLLITAPLWIALLGAFARLGFFAIAAVLVVAALAGAFGA